MQQGTVKVEPRGARPPKTEPEGIADVLAHHVVAADYASLPQPALDAAKRFFLDTLAVAWAGTDAPGSRAVRDMMVQEGGRPESTVWGYGDRLPAGSAAFLNSMNAAALDYDALGQDSNVHVNVVVPPTAFALAEREHANGRQFLAALVIGSDLMCRLGASCETLGNEHKGWFYTSVHGIFAAAATAAKLLGLDAAATRHAFGLALSQVSGTQQCMIEPSLAKRMQSAFAVRAGILSALLAQRGVTAPRQAFEGKFGLYRMYQDGDAERLLADFGRRYENMNLSIKKYPSCGCNHTSIEGALQLVREYELEPDDVISAEVEISPFMYRLVGGEYEPRDNPQVAAQFSVRYSVACAILRGGLGLTDIQAKAALDPAVRSLVSRVSVVEDKTNTGKRAPAIVRIKSKRHGLLARRVDHVPGTPQAPLSDAELRAKIRDCMALGVAPRDEAGIDRLVEQMSRIEDCADMSGFFAAGETRPRA